MPNTPFTYKFARNTPAVAAGADKDSEVGEAPFALTVTDVSYTPVSALTGANTESRTLTLYNRGTDGTGTTIVAQRAFVSGQNIAADDEGVITLSATPANLNVPVGAILEWVSLHIGATGLADPGGLVQVEYQRQDA